MTKLLRKNEAIEEEKQRIEEQKQKIKQKEKVLKNIERRDQKKQILEIGKLACDEKIHTLDKKALIGAFREIAEKSINIETINAWIKKSSINEKLKNNSSAIIVSFEETPSKEIRDKLKSLKFRWNAYRGEYYGRGSKNELEELCQGLQFKIEIR